MKIKFTYLSLAALMGIGLLLGSCSRDRNNPGIQFSPEMYESIPLEPFTQVVDSFAPFKNKRNQQLPPEGTIARGQFAAFDIPNSEDDSIRHSAELKAMVNPIPRTEANLAEGEVLYLRFCGACHGEKGEGNGKVAQHDAINPGAYSSELLKNYTGGELYYAIMYGKGVMGSYASQLDYEGRWKVVHYVETLQGTKEFAYEREVFPGSKAFSGSEEDLEKLKVDEAFSLPTISFASGGAALSGKSTEALEDVHAFLVNNPKVSVAFEGHTDATGDSLANMTLSMERAQAVVDFLLEKGIPANRMKATGFGSDMPVALNNSPGNMARNRRTEMKVLAK